MRNQMMKTVSVFLIALLPSAVLLADTKGAMLYASGAVVVNGVAVNSTVSVFDGDRIDTANNAIGTINQAGSIVAMEPNSAVTYRNKSIDVLRGGARVNTDHGMAVYVDRYSVTPKEGTAKFTVAKLDNKIVVTSREGSLILGGAAKTTVLPPGMAATLDPNPAPAGSGGSGGGGGGGGGGSVWIIAAVGLSAAALGVGIAALTTANSVPTSPFK